MSRSQPTFHVRIQQAEIRFFKCVHVHKHACFGAPKGALPRGSDSAMGSAWALQTYDFSTAEARQAIHRGQGSIWVLQTYDFSIAEVPSTRVMGPVWVLQTFDLNTTDGPFGHGVWVLQTYDFNRVRDLARGAAAPNASIVI